jgi:hypothetical protein
MSKGVEENEIIFYSNLTNKEFNLLIPLQLEVSMET